MRDKDFTVTAAISIRYTLYLNHDLERLHPTLLNLGIKTANLAIIKDVFVLNDLKVGTLILYHMTLNRNDYKTSRKRKNSCN